MITSSKQDGILGGCYYRPIGHLDYFLMNNTLIDYKHQTTTISVTLFKVRAFNAKTKDCLAKLLKA